MRGQVVMGGVLGSPPLLAPDWAPLKYRWQDGGVKGPCLPQPQQAARAGTGCDGLDTLNLGAPRRAGGPRTLRVSAARHRVFRPDRSPSPLAQVTHLSIPRGALLVGTPEQWVHPPPAPPPPPSAPEPLGFLLQQPRVARGWGGLVPEAQVWGLAPAREGSLLRPPHGRGDPGPGQRGSRGSGPAARDGKHLLV